ncbi:MAG TPA: VCBS repeat-containing protein [Verrucomicrobiales bacterium]|nr:VCBS repeat-containing protein [Verrucomicrobiales bacterium]
MAGLFQVLWGKADGSFKKAAVLEGTDGEPLVIPISGEDQQTENICTRPTAIDWDGDGDLDIVTGNFAGTFYLFTGDGNGKFQPKPEIVPGEGGPLRIVGAHSDPFVVDWDGDGDFDLLSGSSSGGVQWAENQAGPGKPPVWRSFVSLIAAPAAPAYGQPVDEKDLQGPAGSTRVWSSDVDGDGKLDILAGDSVTLVSPIPGLEEKEFAKKFEAWNKAVQKASEELNSSSDPETREAAMEKVNTLYKQRSEFMKEDRTGFVWLYRQK